MAALVDLKWSTIMEIISTLVMGAIIGWLASIIAKTSDQMGCIWNILVGIVGAWLGSWLAMKVFKYNVNENSFNWPRFFVGVGGAVVLLTALRMLGVMRRNK